MSRILRNGKLEADPVNLKTDYVEGVEGFYKYWEHLISIPATVGWYVSDVSWDWDVTIYGGDWNTYDANTGDKMQVHFAPDTIVGAITSNVASTDTVIDVDATSIDNLFPGMKMSIWDGTNTDDLGYVKSKDYANGQVTVTTAATQSFSAATPTYVRMTMEMVPEVNFLGPESGNLGLRTQGGKLIPAGTVMRYRYYNTDGVAKKFACRLEIRD